MPHDEVREVEILPESRSHVVWLDKQVESTPVLQMPGDWLVRTKASAPGCTINLGTVEEAMERVDSPPEHICCYTDGSKTEWSSGGGCRIQGGARD